jgi:Na+/melibiose symporter-like transporter
LAFAEPAGPPGAAGNSGFGRVLAAEGASNFGSMLSRLAIPWLAVLTLAATPIQMAALQVAEMLAVALATLWLGTAVDRRGKRAVMLACDGLRALLLALLVGAAWAGVVGIGLLVAVVLLSALATAAFEMARSAWIAQRLAPAALPQGNARLSMVGSVSETAAFALGGWIWQGLGALVALAADALSYLVSALLLRGVPEAPAQAAPARNVEARSARWSGWLKDAAAGVAAIRHHPALRPLAVVQGLLALAMGMTGTAYMIYVARDLALPPAWLGMIAALGAIGAIGGAALAPRLGQWLGPGRTIALGLAAAAVGAACIPLAQGAGLAAIVLLAAHQIVGDAGHTVQEVHERTLRQTAALPALLARVDGGIRTVTAWACLAGTLAGGVLGELLGVRSVLVLAAVVTAIAALWAWRSLPAMPAVLRG